MSIINNILWSFAEGIKSNTTSLTDFVTNKMIKLEPEIDWTSPEYDAHQLIRHLAFVWQNPEIYYNYKKIFGSSNCIVDHLEFVMSINSIEKRDYF